VAVTISPVGTGAVRACVVSYTQLPPAGGLAGLAATAPGLDLPSPPAGYLLFLAVPAIASVAGGWLSARAARGRGGAPVEAGLLSGVGFAAWAGVLAVLAQVGADVVAGSSSAATLAVRAGPEVGRTILVALAWGVAGGAIGGALAPRRLRAPDPPASGPSEAAVEA
jgi:hypothetical protein